MRISILFLACICGQALEAQVSLSWTKVVGAKLNTTPLNHKIDGSGNLFVFGITTDTLCSKDAFYFSELDLNGNEIHQNITSEDISCNRETPYSFSFASGNQIFACGFQNNNQPTGLLYGFNANNLSQVWNHDTGFFFIDCVHGFSNEEYLACGDVTPSLQKWSESGNFIWKYLWTGQNANAFKTFRDRTDGVYLLLNTNDTVPGFMASGFALVRRDTINNGSWSTIFNPKPGVQNLPVESVQDNSGNTYVLTKTINTIDSIYINKISPTGQVLWTSRYGQIVSAYDLKFDKMNDNILALVRVSSGVKIIRFSNTGTILDSSSTCMANQLLSGNPVFDVDTLGNSYVSCVFPPAPTNYTIYIKKINYGGGILWNYADVSVHPILPNHLSVQSDGSVITSFKKDYPSTSVDSILIIKLDQPLGVVESQQSQYSFSVFPNPISSSCFYQITTNSNELLHYAVTNITGKVLLTGKCVSNGNGEFDLSSLASSFYFITLFNEKGEAVVAPQKIIKL